MIGLVDFSSTEMDNFIDRRLDCIAHRFIYIGWKLILQKCNILFRDISSECNTKLDLTQSMLMCGIWCEQSKHKILSQLIVRNKCAYVS